MGKFEKKKPARKKKGVLPAGLAAAAVLIVLLVVLLSGNGPEPEEEFPPESTGQTLETQPSGEETPTEATGTEPAETEQPRLGLTLEAVDQKEAEMVVTTSYCVVKYPFAFSDLIHVSVRNQESPAELLFSMYWSDVEYPMFSVVFDGAGGIPVGTLPLSDGTVVSVAVEIYEADAGMDPDMMQSFYAAQECLNDVLSSLIDNEGFVSAQ